MSNHIISCLSRCTVPDMTEIHCNMIKCYEILHVGGKSQNIMTSKHNVVLLKCQFNGIMVRLLNKNMARHTSIIWRKMMSMYTDLNALNNVSDWILFISVKFSLFIQCQIPTNSSQGTSMIQSNSSHLESCFVVTWGRCDNNGNTAMCKLIHSLTC